MARDEDIYTQFSGQGSPETASWNKCRHIFPEVSQLEMNGNWKALTETKQKNGCQKQWIEHSMNYIKMIPNFQFPHHFSVFL